MPSGTSQACVCKSSRQVRGQVYEWAIQIKACSSSTRILLESHRQIFNCWQIRMSAVFTVIKKKTNGKLIPQVFVPHALGHLKMPVYCCRICNVTKFTSCAIRLHIKHHHPTSDGGYEDCSDQYHQEIMDTLRLCFHVDEKKRSVEQAKRLTIPGRYYDITQSPLHNER